MGVDIEVDCGSFHQRMDSLLSFLFYLKVSKEMLNIGDSDAMVHRIMEKIHVANE